MKIRIENGRIIDPANNLDKTGTLCIDDGTITSILSKPEKSPVDLVIDATGKWICPGIIDLSAHFGEPGQEYKASISSESAAAAKSGITTVCCPPDTRPVIDTRAVAELIQQRAERANRTRIFPIAALTQGLQGDRLAELHTLKEAGCIAVSNAGYPLASNEVLRRAMEYAASTNLIVFIQPLDHALGNGGVVNEGAISTRLGLPPIPETAETVAVSSALLLIEQTGVRAHFCRLSTARAVEMIAAAKKSGLPVSADVDICHLFLTEQDVDNYNADCHLVPPLRTLRDKDALTSALADGVIDAVCSDHHPHNDDSKTAPFSLTSPGASTLEVLLPLMMDLVNRKILSPGDCIDRLSAGPARVLRINSGVLTVGNTADVIVIDPDKSWTLNRQELLSSGRNTPFAGWELSGMVTHTIFEGHVVYPF